MNIQFSERYNANSLGIKLIGGWVQSDGSRGGAVCEGPAGTSRGGTWGRDDPDPLPWVPRLSTSALSPLGSAESACCWEDVEAAFTVHTYPAFNY